MKNRTTDDEYAVLQRFKDRLFFDLKVADIGIITEYDKSSNLAKILPLSKNRDKDTKEEFIKPLLSNVSVFGREPVTGELCIVLFLDKDVRDIIKGFKYDKNKPFEEYTKFIKSLNHNINNAVAISGLFSKDLQFTYEQIKFLKENYDEYKIKFIVKNWNILHKLIIDNGGVEPNEN